MVFYLPHQNRTLIGGASVALMLCGSFPALAAPRITEFVAINASSLLDGDGNASDWIEIHNPDGVPLDLAGYQLTDDPEVPAKFTFANGASIPAGGYLVVFASGRPEADYVDAGSKLHTNFSLSGSGEYLSLRAPNGTLIQEFAPSYPPQFEDVSYGEGTSAPTLDLISQGAASSWLIPDRDIGDAWQTLGFDDSSWAAAETGIGYGNDYADLVGPGGNTSAMFFGNPSVYLRLPFEVADPANIASLSLKMRFEDGFVAYLNGVRVASANAPDEASLLHDSTATAIHPDEEAVVAEVFSIPTGSLVSGTNVLAIQGLNFTSAGADSSEFLALPELSAIESGGQLAFGYFTEPTPETANGPIPLLGFVEDTTFSVDRGYHSAPFDLVISSATPGATIVYTTDGTPPSAENGTTYSGPLTISGTTTLRAIAMKDGFQPTNIDTQTYLFLEDILEQTRPAGYPTTWGGAPADYDMDSDIVNDRAYKNEFDKAFAAMPTLSLVFEPDAFFHSSTGIYQRPGSEGRAWERPLSAEFFVPGGAESGFQIDAGVRIQGGSSRNVDTPKHSLSLRFRSEYGQGKLNYPLFENSPSGETAVEEFDALQLRPEYNFGWMHRHFFQCDYALYGRDQWTSDMFNRMGQNGAHGRWVHLFLNGTYWGLYDLHERPDADHMANYFGGDDDDYDTVNSAVATNGDLVAYNEMMDLGYGSIQTAGTYAAIQEYLDLDAFIDYMMLNYYIGNRDWDFHNWRAARKREAGAPFLFFPWDSEFAASHVAGGAFPNVEFFNTALATNMLGSNRNRNPTGLQQRLETNVEYRLRFADRVRKHFFNGGPLSSAVSEEIWTERATPMKEAIIAESARWGDFRRDVNEGRWEPSDFDLYTRDEHYLPTEAWFVDAYIPQRTDIVLAQMRAANLYPDTDAPDFSQYGGTVPLGSSVILTAPATIHYTTDGSDPRLSGGNVNPSAAAVASGVALMLNRSTLLKARTRAGNGEWSALTEATFTIGASDLVISELMYQPAGEPLAEFLEITNTGAATVSLTGLHFSNGVTFDFDLDSSIFELAPGARLLIVRDLIAFQSVHGNVYDSIIAGSFQEDTVLSDKGERVTISDANGTIIFTVRYDDEDAWPEEPDGDGQSLVFTGGESELAQNWRSSAAIGGNPGDSDATPFTGGSFLDYALVGEPILVPNGAGAAFTYATHLTSDDASVSVEHSADLLVWQTIDLAAQTQVIGSGNATRIFTLEFPLGITGFARVVVSAK
ncbi:lamin tail domain-containing protein [Akkermansiaceae bacterium]|nr:lamin tail domain-containing protein [Akkermansiaceae bacterium]MDB4143513.1 lamin tail domain-containing protein [Akkermansiaceae bacterium]